MTSSDIYPSDTITTRRELLDSVDQISNTLAASAVDSERLATLAPDAVGALVESGLLRMKLPLALGGAEADPATQIEVIEALAAVDTASAWCTMVGATSIALLGAFLPDEGVHDVFPDGAVPMAANSFFPAGIAIVEGGGYRVSGRWRFCSGIRHSDWVSVGAVVRQSEVPEAESSGPPDVLFAVVPTAEIEIHDNWQAMGLKGTGSCDISVADVYVPDHLTFRWDLVNPQPRRGGPLYRLPAPGFVVNEHIGFALGVARRALDELIGQVRHTRGAFRASALSERQIVDRLIGKFDLELSAARALALDRHRAIWEQLLEGKQIDAAFHAELRSIGTYVTELAVNIVTTAYRYGGAGALFQPNILERLLRDTNAAAQHIAVSDEAYEAYGKHVIGLSEATI